VYVLNKYLLKCLLKYKRKIKNTWWDAVLKKQIGIKRISIKVKYIKIKQNTCGNALKW
jgi:hypothetical protein